MTIPLPEDEAECEADILTEIRLRRRQETLLAKHPDCRDPDHPGCILCLDAEGRPRARRILTLPKKQV